MQAARGAEFNFIGVAGRSDLAEHLEFVDRFGVAELTHVYDDSGDFWASFGVRSQPAWAFINDDGTAEVLTGRLGVDGLNERIDTLVGT